MPTPGCVSSLVRSPSTGDSLADFPLKTWINASFIPDSHANSAIALAKRSLAEADALVEVRHLPLSIVFGVFPRPVRFAFSSVFCSFSLIFVGFPLIFAAHFRPSFGHSSAAALVRSSAALSATMLCRI